MDTYETDSVTCIRQNVILIGSPIAAAMPAERAVAEGRVRPFTGTGCTVYVKRFFYDDDMESSDEEVVPKKEGEAEVGEEFMPGADDDDGGGDRESWAAEKARLERLTTYTCPPTAFRWRALSGVTIVSPGVERRGAYELVVGGDGQLSAYLLPWIADGITWMHLDFGCRFFFTDVMNGCTLHIGGSAQTPVVAHSNVGMMAAIGERGAAQLTYMKERIPMTLAWRWFAKTDYMSASERDGRTQEGYAARVGTQANVIGFNNGILDGWQFWAQSYMLYTESNRKLVRDITVTKLFPTDAV